MKSLRLQPFHSRPHLFALMLPGLLAGCMTVGPDYQQEVPDVPKAWSEPSGTNSLTACWQKLNADEGLEYLLDKSLNSSPDISIAIARLKQARAMQNIQEAAYWPELAFKGQITDDRISRNGELFSNMPSRDKGQADFTNRTVALDVAWEIDIFGYHRRANEAAKARADVATERVSAARLTLTAELVRAYFDFRVMQSRVKLARRQLQILEAQLEINRHGLNEGYMSMQEIRRLQNARNAYAATIPSLEIGERQNLATLSLLSVIPVPELAERFQTEIEIPELPAAPDAGLPVALLQRRPDLRIAERELAAASADVGVAVAAQYPRISLSGEGGWMSVQSTNLFSSNSQFWSIGPSLYLPLFSGGRLRNQVIAKEAALEESKSSFQKTLLTAMGEVEVALTQLNRSATRREEMRNAAEEQQRVLELARIRLKAGDISRFAMLEEERVFITQQDLEFQAKGQSLSALATLYKALGGAW